jgi:hypothetical protein
MGGYNDQTEFITGIYANDLSADRTVFAAGSTFLFDYFIGGVLAGIYNITLRDGDSNVIDEIRVNAGTYIYEYHCKYTNGLIVDVSTTNANNHMVVMYYAER